MRDGASAAMVGIFWRCHDRWWHQACLVSEVLADSLGFVVDPLSHYDYWQQLQHDHSVLRDVEYDDSKSAPRGRIVFNAQDE